MSLFNSSYTPIKPADYKSKYEIPYQNAQDFYDIRVFNDCFYLLERELLKLTGKLTELKLTDENIDVVAEDKKLSEVLPTVARKGEILPKDIKGNTDYITSFLLPNLTSTGELEYRFVNGDGSYKAGFTNLSSTYAKKTDLERMQSTIDGIKQDIGGYAKRLETANNGIEARL